MIALFRRNMVVYLFLFSTHLGISTAKAEFSFPDKTSGHEGQNYATDYLLTPTAR